MQGELAKPQESFTIISITHQHGIEVEGFKPAIKLGFHGPINYIDYHAKGLTKMDHYVTMKLLEVGGHFLLLEIGI